MKKTFVTFLLFFIAYGSVAQQGKALLTDSIILPLPMKYLEGLEIKENNNCIYILATLSSMFYELSMKGKVNKILDLKKVANKSFSPVSFSIGKNYIQFSGAYRTLLLDRAYKFYGYYFLPWDVDTIKRRWFTPENATIHFSDEDAVAFISVKTFNQKSDDKTIITQELTRGHYLEKYLGFFQVPDSKISDSTHEVVLNPQAYICQRGDFFLNPNGFIPFFDYRYFFFDDYNHFFMVSEPPDSSIYQYDYNGNLLKAFGNKGKNIKKKDSIRYITSFDFTPKDYMSRLECYEDSLKYHCAYYTDIFVDTSQAYTVRLYHVPDSLNLVSMKEAGYYKPAFEDYSKIYSSKYLQVYYNYKWIADYKIPNDWHLSGFVGEKLMFYKTDEVTGKLHLYYTRL